MFYCISFCPYLRGTHAAVCLIIGLRCSFVKLHKWFAESPPLRRWGRGYGAGFLLFTLIFVVIFRLLEVVLGTKDTHWAVVLKGEITKPFGATGT